MIRIFGAILFLVLFYNHALSEDNCQYNLKFKRSGASTFELVKHTKIDKENESVVNSREDSSADNYILYSAEWSLNGTFISRSYCKISISDITNENFISAEFTILVNGPENFTDGTLLKFTSVNTVNSANDKANIITELDQVSLILNNAASVSYKKGQSIALGSIARQLHPVGATIDNEDKIKIVILSEGYTPSELINFDTHAQNVVDTFKNDSYFGSKMDNIIIYSLRQASEESGISIVRVKNNVVLVPAGNWPTEEEIKQFYIEQYSSSFNVYKDTAFSFAIDFHKEDIYSSAPAELTNSTTITSFEQGKIGDITINNSFYRVLNDLDVIGGKEKLDPDILIKDNISDGVFYKIFIVNIPLFRANAVLDTFFIPTGESNSNTLTHEFGHTFGKLSDEYYKNNSYTQEFIDRFKNLDFSNDPINHIFPWQKWNNTFDNLNGNYINFDKINLDINGNHINVTVQTIGNNTVNTNFYRPSNKCMMFNNYAADHYCLVCKDILNTKFLSDLNIVKDVSPSEDEPLDVNNSILNIELIQLAGFKLKWKINDKTVASDVSNINLNYYDITGATDVSCEISYDPDGEFIRMSDKDAYARVIKWQLTNTTKPVFHRDSTTSFANKNKDLNLSKLISTSMYIPFGENFEFIIESPPSHGSFDLTTLTYTPSPNYVGYDNFSVKIKLTSSGIISDNIRNVDIHVLDEDPATYPDIKIFVKKNEPLESFFSWNSHYFVHPWFGWNLFIAENPDVGQFNFINNVFIPKHLKKKGVKHYKYSYIPKKDFTGVDHMVLRYTDPLGNFWGANSGPPTTEIKTVTISFDVRDNIHDLTDFVLKKAGYIPDFISIRSQVDSMPNSVYNMDMLIQLENLTYFENLDLGQTDLNGHKVKVVGNGNAYSYVSGKSKPLEIKAPINGSISFINLTLR